METNRNPLINNLLPLSIILFYFFSIILFPFLLIHKDQTYGPSSSCPFSSAAQGSAVFDVNYQSI